MSVMDIYQFIRNEEFIMMKKHFLGAVALITVVAMTVALSGCFTSDEAVVEEIGSENENENNAEIIEEEETEQAPVTEDSIQPLYNIEIGEPIDYEFGNGRSFRVMLTDEGEIIVMYVEGEELQTLEELTQMWVLFSASCTNLKEYANHSTMLLYKWNDELYSEMQSSETGERIMNNIPQELLTIDVEEALNTNAEYVNEFRLLLNAFKEKGAELLA
jgi:hypothetical protein